MKMRKKLDGFEKEYLHKHAGRIAATLVEGAIVTECTNSILNTPERMEVIAETAYAVAYALVMEGREYEE